jgi:hypothetical protein
LARALTGIAVEGRGNACAWLDGLNSQRLAPQLLEIRGFNGFINHVKKSLLQPLVLLEVLDRPSQNGIVLTVRNDKAGQTRIIEPLRRLRAIAQEMVQFIGSRGCRAKAKRRNCDVWRFVSSFFFGHLHSGGHFRR